MLAAWRWGRGHSIMWNISARPIPTHQSVKFSTYKDAGKTGKFSYFFPSTSHRAEFGWQCVKSACEIALVNILSKCFLGDITIAATNWCGFTNASEGKLITNCHGPGASCGRHTPRKGLLCTSTGPLHFKGCNFAFSLSVSSVRFRHYRVWSGQENEGLTMS